MTYNTILFDLDGTLTDPAQGIVNSVIYALKKFGITEDNREKLLKFIGPPLAESFSKYYGFSAEDAYRAVDYYREYYAKKGIFENCLYEGVPQLLSALKSSGKIVALATSKPEIFAKQILKHFKIDSYFDFVGGSNLDNSRVIKSEVIRYVISNLPLLDTSNIIMVGDREHDVFGATDNNLSCIGVLFGYGSREELSSAGAIHLALTVNDLKKLIL